MLIGSDGRVYLPSQEGHYQTITFTLDQDALTRTIMVAILRTAVSRSARRRDMRGGSWGARHTLGRAPLSAH